MNILFVNSTRKWGGVKTWSLDNALAMRKLGHDAAVVGRPGPFIDKARALGIPATEHAFGFDFNPLSILFFLRLFRTHRTEMLILNISKDLRTAGVAARLAGIPMVQHLGAPGDVQNRFKTRLTQRLLRPALVTCSDFVRQALLRSVPIYKDYPFEFIYPGTEISPAPPASVNAPRVIITTSQLNPDKQHGHLLEGLSLLKKDGYDFRCIIVGTGRDEKRLKQQCRKLGLDKQVEWTGFVKNVQKELQRADIFVLPTGCEPLGIALEEAMANGLVSVARNIGGPPEIWPPKLTGLLVEPAGEGKEFRAILAKLLNMPKDQLLSLKRTFKEHAEKTFSIDKQARELLAWLHEIV
ncbi:glycosyltransferase [Desulfovibrio caledoniensis]